MFSKHNCRHSFWHNFAVVLLGCFLLVLAACTRNRPHRTYLPQGASQDRPASLRPIDPIKSAVIETNQHYTLGFVEFDEQGWFWSYKQWDAVKKQLKLEAGQNQNGVVTLVFVHGWKNNAKHDNSNVQTFRAVLTNLAEIVKTADKSIEPNQPPRRVLGVYVGWRGLSVMTDILPPLGKEASFYRRKAVAERIGHQGAATQLFTELDLMHAAFNTNRANGPKSKLIFVGHSFGAALLYSATSQILTEHLAIAADHKGPRLFKWLGDLVILINPAFEAAKLNNAMALAGSGQIQSPPDQRPVLAIFTSETDWATKYAFPFGRRLATWSYANHPSEDRWLFSVPKDKPANQAKAIRQTVGNNRDFISHRLTFTNYVKSSPKDEKQLLTGASTPERLQELEELWRPHAGADSTPRIYPVKDDKQNYVCVLSAVPHHFERNKVFVNATVDKEIIDGHNDIRNPVFIRFLTDFMVSVQTNLIATPGSSRERAEPNAVGQELNK